MYVHVDFRLKMENILRRKVVDANEVGEVSGHERLAPASFQTLTGWNVVLTCEKQIDCRSYTSHTHVKPQGIECNQINCSQKISDVKLFHWTELYLFIFLFFNLQSSPVLSLAPNAPTLGQMKDAVMTRLLAID